MGFRGWFITAAIVFSIPGLIFLYRFFALQQYNATFSSSTCTIVNYSFVANGDCCYKSWIDIQTSDGAKLTFWYYAYTYDVQRQTAMFSVDYPIGRSGTCWLNTVTWVWNLSDTEIYLAGFCMFFGMSGLALVLLIIFEIVGCVNARRTPKHIPDEQHVELQVSSSSNDVI